MMGGSSAIEDDLGWRTDAAENYSGERSLVLGRWSLASAYSLEFVGKAEECYPSFRKVGERIEFQSLGRGGAEAGRGVPEEKALTTKDTKVHEGIAESGAISW
jgi:hypothetical protein